MCTCIWIILIKYAHSKNIRNSNNIFFYLFIFYFILLINIDINTNIFFLHTKHLCGHLYLIIHKSLGASYQKDLNSRVKNTYSYIFLRAIDLILKFKHKYIILKTCNNYKTNLLGLELCCLTPLSTIFQLYRDGQFYCGGNWSTRRKSPTCRKSLTNFIT